MIAETPMIFPSGSVLLSGLMVREEVGSSVRQIGVIVTGSWLTVKEQMALLYARRLAAVGYAAFVFDFAGFGESGGEPRQAEIPARKIQDLSAAATGVARRMAFARQDAAAFLRSEPRSHAAAYGPGDERAGMHFELDYYANSARGAVASWKNEMAQLSWTHWLTFDGLSIAVSNSIPSLMVHGPGCALPDNARRVYQRWTGPKRLEWREGEQTEFYDRPEQVDRSTRLIDDWFKTHLASSARAAAS